MAPFSSILGCEDRFSRVYTARTSGLQIARNTCPFLDCLPGWGRVKLNGSGRVEARTAAIETMDIEMGLMGLKGRGVANAFENRSHAICDFGSWGISVSNADAFC